jgi:hypothetical protein
MSAMRGTANKRLPQFFAPVTTQNMIKIDGLSNTSVPKENCPHDTVQKAMGL